MKLTVIGGGGVRSMFLSKSIAVYGRGLGIDRLTLMDNDPVKLNIFGTMAKALAARIDPELKVELTTDPVRALDGTDYVITTIRVGGDDLRVKDERAALSCGILGQETTGAAGFSFAMRSIPALVGYCRMTERYAAKGAKVFNFTNPAGIVSEALRREGFDFTYGICDAPSGMLRQFRRFYNGTTAELKGYGLNHLSFFSSVVIDGVERVHDLIADPEAYRRTDLRFFDPATLKNAGEIFNEYVYYYLNPERAVRNILAAKETRGELIARVNRALIAELKDFDVEKNFDRALAIYGRRHAERENAYMATETGVRRDTEFRFDPLTADDGYAGVALDFIRNSRSGSGSMVLCVPNNGAIDDLEKDDVIETSVRFERTGFVNDRAGKLKDYNREWIVRVKAYEREGAKAILSRDKAGAIAALSEHPLIGKTYAEGLVGIFERNNKEFFEGWR